MRPRRQSFPHGSRLAACLSFLAAAALLALAPRAGLAQTTPQNDLRATIRAEILSDPRSSSLSSAQVEGMVALLAQQAQQEGMTAQDITWRPANSPYTLQQPNTAAAPACGSLPALLCALNAAFGLDGSDPRIAIGLGAASALLIFIIGAMLEMRRRAFAAGPPGN